MYIDILLLICQHQLLARLPSTLAQEVVEQMRLCRGSGGSRVSSDPAMTEGIVIYWRFPEMGVPFNHLLSWDFPLYNNDVGVPLFQETSNYHDSINYREAPDFLCFPKFGSSHFSYT